MIAPDDPAKLEAMREKMGLSFPTLVDADLAATKAYGILNEQNGKLPHPTALIVDKKGIVRFVRIDEDYSKRPPSEDLLTALKGE